MVYRESDDRGGTKPTMSQELRFKSVEHCGPHAGRIRLLPVTERRAVALGDLLYLVVVGQHKERLLEFAHLFHFGHHVLVDAIHDLLQTKAQTPLASTIWSFYSRVWGHLLVVFEGYVD